LGRVIACADGQVNPMTAKDAAKVAVRRINPARIID
jgi:hypothetical protein